MDKITTLIVDDEKLARRAVRSLLEKDPDIHLVGEAADGAAALDSVRRLQPQLVFLDVQMPLLSGVEVLQHLVPAGRPEVIFVTAFDEHAIKAFELHAIDYLVKPFSDVRFQQALDRAKTRVRSATLAGTERALGQLLEHFKVKTPAGAPASPPTASATGRLVVKADGELHFVEQRDIRWIEGQGDFVKIHMQKGRLLSRMTMHHVLGQLDPTRFLRIHKSNIVNLSSMRRVKPILSRSLGVELDDGTVVPVGRNYRQDLERHFN